MKTISQALGDRNVKDATVFTAATTLHGELVSSSPVIVYGTIKGNCEIDNLLRIEASGTWIGTVRAASVVIHGKVEGDVITDGRLEVGETGRIHGDVTARRLVVARGAVIEGIMRMADSGTNQLVFEGKQKT